VGTPITIILLLSRQIGPWPAVAPVDLDRTGKDPVFTYQNAGHLPQ
jgi:hypothetical protein